MQSLKLAEKYFDAIGHQTHRASVRLGRRDITLGELNFKGAENPVENIDVTVHTVVHTTYDRLTPEQIDTVGLGSRSELFNILRGHYPDFAMSSEITFIEWG